MSSNNIMQELDFYKLGIQYKSKYDVWLDYYSNDINSPDYDISIVYGTMYILSDKLDNIKKSQIEKYDNVIVGKFTYLDNVYDQITILDDYDYYNSCIDKSNVSKRLSTINLYYN